MSKLPQRLIDQKIRADLKEQVEIIKKHWPFFESSVIEIGKALQKIRAEKLYRLDYKTLDEFCRAMFGFGSSHAYRVMHKAEPAQISYKPGAQTSPNGVDQATSEGGDNPTPLCPACLGESDRCDACKPLWEEWSNVERVKAKYKVPKYLFPAFADGEKAEKASAKLKSAAELLKEFDEAISSRLISMAASLTRRIPSEACGCNPDADCDECKGKGWLNATQAQRRKERVNF